ncbi:MAG: hypothetical protein FWF82_05865, partial [Oscillospiraceae bacterium]|nr:hypothetical protein [Oscillospiraceae bacterium]
MKKFLSAAVAAAMLLTFAPLMTSPQSMTASAAEFVVTNPYANVNWNTYNQYKAAQHVHSTNSDGSDTISAMAETHYERGYHIVSFTDHDTITESPDKTPTSTNGGYSGYSQTPLTAERVAAMAAGEGRSGTSGGMLFVPFTNERSQRVPASFTRRGQHVNTYWSNIPNGAIDSEDVEVMLGRLNSEGTGIANLNHIGRNVCTVYAETDAARGTQNWQVAKERMSNPTFVSHYTNLFKNNPRLVGMELINELDNESQGSDVMWDNILKSLNGSRTVWGYAADDSHTTRNVGWSYNIMVMPELSMAEYRKSMESGAFFAFSRVNRRYGIYAGTIIPEDTRGGTANFDRMEPTLALPTPEVKS